MAEMKEGYKQTDIGVIPEDWDESLIGDLFDFKNGLNKAKEFFGYGTPIVNYMDVFNFAGLQVKNVQGKVDVTFQEKQNFSVKKGDVFFTRTSETVEEIGIASVMLDDCNETVFSGFVLRGRPKSKLIETEYCKYCFASDEVRKKITSKSTYTTRALTNGRLLSSVILPLPKPEEQKAIAAVLSDVDGLIESLEQLIAKKRDMKTAAMQQLLTGKKRLPGFEEKEGYKQTDIGVIPEDWNIKWLGELGNFAKGAGIKKDEAQSGTLPCVRYGELYTKHHDTIRSFHSFISEEVSKNSKKLKCGDILFAGSGETKEEIGKCASFLDKGLAYAGGDIIILSPHSGNSKFLGYLLNSDKVAQQKASLGQGDAVVHINAKSLASILIALPKPEEQTAIAAVLSDMDAEIDALKQRLEKARSLKTGMMQELLTGRTRLMKTHKKEEEV